MISRVINLRGARSTSRNVPGVLWALLAILALGAATIAIVTQPVVPADVHDETIARDVADSSPGAGPSIDNPASSKALAAETARLNGLAEFYGVRRTRSQVAETARLNGLAEFYGVRRTRSQVAETARLHGMAEWFGVADQ